MYSFVLTCHLIDALYEGSNFFIHFHQYLDMTLNEILYSEFYALQDDKLF